MENRVIFNLDQDLGPDDLTALQAGVSDTFDHLVAETVTSGKRYAGLAVTKSTATAAGVAPGTLYANGRMYDFPSAVLQDFVTSLPLAGKRIVTVVAYGSEADTDVTAREFVIDETTIPPTTQARPVATRHRRVCNVQFAYGVAAPSPTAPLLDPGYTAVADILLSTAGIDTIAMRAETRVGNLDDLDDRVGNLETFEGAIGPKVTTLTSDLANLSVQLKQSASADILGQLLVRLAVIEAKDKIPTAAVSSHAYYFLDKSASDLANVLSACKVQEGIRFPNANAGTGTLGLLNPNDVNAKAVNGLLLPAYDRKLWLSTGEASDQIRLSGYTYQTNALVQRTMSRQVTNYGTPFTVCTNGLYWQTGSYDINNNLFYRDGEAFTVAATANYYGANIGAGDWTAHNVLRLQQIWTTTVSEPYWDTVTTDHDVNGSFVCETFLQGQDIWLDAVGLFFTKLADAGDATIVIGEASSANGLPDVTKVISVTNLARASMQAAGAETVVGITPAFLASGKRFYVAIVTAADHSLATVPGEQFTQGTLFSVLDGAYAQGDGTRDLQLNLYRAVPRSARSSIQLTSLQLDGGILAISINADTIVPANCSLSYEIQVAGTWYGLQDVDAYMLGQGGSVPPLLPFRATFVGTGDIMPGVALTGSQTKVERPATTLVHIGAAVAVPGAGSTQIRVIQRYESWNGAHHTAGIKLRTGAGYATITNPSSYTDVLGTDPVAGAYLERTYVFNLGAAVTSYKVETDGATDTNRLTYHVAWEKDWTL